MTMITTSVSMPFEKSGSPASTGFMIPAPGGCAAGALGPRSPVARTPEGARPARSPEGLHSQVGDGLVRVDELAGAGSVAVHREERGALCGGPVGGERQLDAPA